MPQPAAMFRASNLLWPRTRIKLNVTNLDIMITGCIIFASRLLWEGIEVLPKIRYNQYKKKVPISGYFKSNLTGFSI
jgi:hypothetical protein